MVVATVEENNENLRLANKPYKLFIINLKEPPMLGFWIRFSIRYRQKTLMGFSPSFNDK